MASNDLAKLVVKLEAQTAKYQAGLEKAQRQLRKFQSDTNRNLQRIQRQFTDFGSAVARSLSFASVTTAVYGLSRAIGSAIQAGDDLAKFASKSGLAAEAASELAHAARMADIDIQGLAVGIKTMQVAISNAASGGKAANQTLAALGLTFEQLRDLKADQQFELIADRISKLEDPTDRTRAAVELFGKAGAELLPLFEQGAAGIRKLREETPKVFSADDLKRLTDADDAMKRLSASVDSLNASLAITASPLLTSIFTTLEKKLSNIKGTLFDFLTTPPHLWFAKFGQEILNTKEKLEAPVTQSGPMGRVLPGLDADKPPGYTNTATVAKLSKSEMAEWERFAHQGIQIANDQAAAFNSIAPPIEENQRALNKYFAEVNEANLEATSRVIEFGQVYEEQSETVTAAAQHAAENINDAFVSFFLNMDKGFKGMAQGFVRALQQMVAQLAASQLMKWIGGGLAGSSNSFLASIGSAFLVPGRAAGGPVAAGHPYMVGERGPELFVPGASGNILPGGAGEGFYPTYNINVDSRSDRAAVRQDAFQIALQVSRKSFEEFREFISRGGRVR